MEISTSLIVGLITSSFYGIFLAIYILSQLYYAIKESRRQSFYRGRIVYPTPSVLVLLPYYNESFDSISSTMDSILNSSFSGRLCIAVRNDGSVMDHSEALKSRYFHEIHEGVVVVSSGKVNVGKRQCQVDAYISGYDYILTVDSDTDLDPHCIENMVNLAVNDNADAVSGGVLVKRQPGLLNRLLLIRYWTANWQERLSQSYFGLVGCCSGPCSLWSSSMFEKVKGEYTSQVFLGKPCTYGDDRHLTNLFLKYGARVVMCSDSVCYTQTQDTIRKLANQQLRWSKSFIRECYWSAVNLKGKLNWFFIYQHTVMLLLPILLVANVILYFVIDFSAMTSLKLLVAIFLAAWVRGAYAFYRTKDKFYLLAPLYGILHIAIVFPIRIYAMFRLNDTKWGTR